MEPRLGNGIFPCFFAFLRIGFLTRIANVDMVVWDDTRIVPMGNTVHRNNWICY